MTTYYKEVKYLRQHGFMYDAVEDAYIKPIREDTIEKGIIIVRFICGRYLHPIFRTKGSIYLSIPTLEKIANLLDKYDNGLSDIELGR